MSKRDVLSSYVCMCKQGRRPSNIHRIYSNNRPLSKKRTFSLFMGKRWPNTPPPNIGLATVVP